MKLTDDVKQRKQKHFKQYRTAKQKLTNKENLVRFLHRGKPNGWGQDLVLPNSFPAKIALTQVRTQPLANFVFQEF